MSARATGLRAGPDATLVPDAPKPPSRPNNVEGDLREPVSGRDHLRGESDAEITLLQYGDFECRHCRTIHPVLQELRREYGPRLRVAFRHMPLPSIHPGAVRAALAAEAAGEQGRFWEMHDLLLEQDGEATGDRMAQLADELDLDTERFKEAIEVELFAERIEADVDSAARSGVSEVPAFFANGTRHRGRNDLEGLRKTIEEQLG